MPRESENSWDLKRKEFCPAYWETLNQYHNYYLFKALRLAGRLVAWLLGWLVCCFLIDYVLVLSIKIQPFSVQDASLDVCPWFATCSPCLDYTESCSSLPAGSQLSTSSGTLRTDRSALLREAEDSLACMWHASLILTPPCCLCLSHSLFWLSLPCSDKVLGKASSTGRLHSHLHLCSAGQKVPPSKTHKPKVCSYLIFFPQRKLKLFLLFRFSVRFPKNEEMALKNPSWGN